MRSTEARAWPEILDATALLNAVSESAEVGVVVAEEKVAEEKDWVVG